MRWQDVYTENRFVESVYHWPAHVVCGENNAVTIYHEHECALIIFRILGWMFFHDLLSNKYNTSNHCKIYSLFHCKRTDCQCEIMTSKIVQIKKVTSLTCIICPSIDISSFTFKMSIPHTKKHNHDNAYIWILMIIVINIRPAPYKMPILNPWGAKLNNLNFHPL